MLTVTLQGCLFRKMAIVHVVFKETQGDYKPLESYYILFENPFDFHAFYFRERAQTRN